MKVIVPAVIALLTLARVSPAQLAPSGRINVEQPGGVHYLFGSGGTDTGGDFSILITLLASMMSWDPFRYSPTAALLAYLL